MRILLMMFAAVAAFFVAILGWSIFLGWLLTLILSFKLFEGTLLAMIATGIGIYLVSQISRSMNAESAEWDETYDSPHDIPVERFVKSPTESTWENWVRYEVANAILVAFKETLKAGQMTDEQLESLAIRLSDPTVAILKRKTGQSSHIEVTVSQLRKELQRMDIQPYDQDILDAAVEGIDLALSAPIVESVVRNKLWKLSVPMPEK